MKLIICRGLPACGKTTRAVAWVAENPGGRARVNRDDVRSMLHDGLYLGDETERQVRAVQHAAILELLRLGVEVVCDDTNLKPDIYDALLDVARLVGADVETWDMRDVPPDVCVQRDRTRSGRAHVGAAAILKMANELL